MCVLLLNLSRISRGRERGPRFASLRGGKKFTVHVEILSSERNKEKLSGLYSIEFVGISRGKFQDRCGIILLLMPGFLSWGTETETDREKEHYIGLKRQ